MEKEKRYDLKISGIGNSAGGVFNEVVIDGKGEINGDISCRLLKINGVGTVNGNIESETSDVNGISKINGSLNSTDFKINGTANIGGEVKAKRIRMEGMASFKGSVSAESVENEGLMNVAGDCTAESFVSKGSFTVGGLLNAGNIEVELYGSCKAGEIGCEIIKVRKGNSFNLKRLIKSIFPMLNINTGLCTEAIEGDDIYLEYTIAKVVRGGKVVIGEGCEIELVEYRSSFDVSGKSSVKENIKLQG